MLIKRERVLELQQKGIQYDLLLQDLQNAEVRVTLNGMPLLVIDMLHLLFLLKLNGEVEICKTHGTARVDARVTTRANKYGTMEKRTEETSTGRT